MRRRARGIGLGRETPQVPLDPRRVLTAIGETVYDWDLATDAIAWGVNAAEVLGVPDLKPLSSGCAFDLATEPGAGATRREAILGGEAADHGGGVPYRACYALRLPKGRILRVEDTGRWYADASGRPALVHGVVRVDRSREAGESLSALLRDRTDFLKRLGDEISEALRSKRPLSLLVVSIADLDRLNDERGSEGADAVIEEVVGRLLTVMRRRDFWVRYAGDRFALVLTSCAADQIAAAAERLTKAVKAPPTGAGDDPLILRLQIGGAAAPQHALDAPGLLRRAEEALAAAKRGGGPSFAVHDASPAHAKRASIAPRIDIVDALNGRRIAFARQPVVDAHARTPVFHEALLRVCDAGGRPIGAGELLPAVERIGLAPLVDARMLELAAGYLAAHPEEQLSINVSPLTIETADWLGALAAHLGARRGIAPRLIVEIPETAAARDPEGTRARLDAMKALGVAVAIDGFGAGNVPLKLLRNLPVDILKIDGAFVQNLARATDDRFFVRSLIDLAQHLGIGIVADWVEDEETARMLAAWGVDYLQGEWCGAPLSAAEDERQVRKIA
jgi:diguanylate cyclase (GGDEF)-like protein